MNFEVEEWLQKIVAVKHESGISRLLQQLRWSAEIESFLRRLETNLRALDDVTKSMEMYPKVGQLLGRLCTLPALLVIPSVYKVLIRCVLCFYSSYPVEDVGKKAKPWALTQIRNSLSYTRNYNPTLLLDKTGFSQGTLNECCTSKVCVRIFVTCKNQNGHEHLGITDIKKGSEQQICELAKLCLYLLHIPQYCDLQVEVICLISSERVPDKDVENTLAEIGNFLSKGASSPENSNVYRVCLSLWLNHLPSLEMAVLRATTVFIARDTSPHYKEPQTSKYNYLVRACAEQRTIHSAVFTMLEQIRRDVSDDGSLSQFIADLHADIKSHNWNKNHKIAVPLLPETPLQF